MTEEKNKVTARKATPEEKSWLDFLQKAEQETPNRLEDAAKFLATMISISLSLFLVLGKPLLEQPQLPVLLWSGLALLFLALLSAFEVLFPRRYHFARQSAKDIQEMLDKVVKTKHRLLLASVFLYLLAFLLIIVSIIVN